MTEQSITVRTPDAHLDSRYSDPAATATPWEDALDVLNNAEIFWISTVRPEGRPHVTPLIAVWLEDALYFSTGEHERKRRNIAENAHCILTTGTNRESDGLDVVVEGKAIRVINEARLRDVARAHEVKYGSRWAYDVEGDAFRGAGGNVAWVFRVAPETVFGFGKGQLFSQTRWTF